MIKLIRIFAIVLLSSPFISCRGEVDKGKLLEKNDAVFVLLNSSSMDSLNKKLSPTLENYGDVKGEDFVPVYKYTTIMQDWGENLALMVYTDKKLIPSGEMYMPSRIRQLFENVANGSARVNAISVNPDAGGEDSFIISSKEIVASLPHLKEVPPLPLAIYLSN